MNRKKVAIVTTIACMIIICLFSAQGGEGSTQLSSRFMIEFAKIPIIGRYAIYIRKFAHVFLYFCLSIQCFITLYLWVEERFLRLSLWAYIRKISWYTVGVCFVFACLDELHQTFVPGRDGKYQDVLVDMIGIVGGILVMWLFFYIKQKIDSK